MVYLSSWQEFQEAAEALYEKSPAAVSGTSLLYLLSADRTAQTRYCVKWRAADGKLVLKITDNTTVSRTITLPAPQSSSSTSVSQI